MFLLGAVIITYLPIRNVFSGITLVIEDRRMTSYIKDRWRIWNICYITYDTILLQYKQLDNVVCCYYTHLLKSIRMF